MPKYLTMPKIGMNMVEGVITKWLIAPGDHVEKEQVILESETDKAVQEIVATESGVVHKLLVAEGDTVPIQAKIAVLLEEGEDAASIVLEGDTTIRVDKRETPVSVVPEPQTKPVKKGAKLRISPLARKTAANFGIDINELSPRKSGLRITKADVLKYLKEPVKVEKPVEEQTGQFLPFTPTRRSIAAHMVNSNCNKPRVTLQASADCEGLLAWRRSYEDSERVSLNALLMKIVAWALRANPQLNSISAEDGIVLSNEINICIAMEVPKGLVTPVIRNVDRLNLQEITNRISKLAQKAEEGRIEINELEGGTFTITNLGSLGVESFDPIINGNQCAILGVGAILDVPVAYNGELVVRKRINYGLSFDHAMVDGAVAARLLRDIKAVTENPFLILNQQ